MNDHEEHTQKSGTLFGLSTKIIVICLVLAGAAITAVTVFRVSVNSLIFIGLLLACPLMHIFMMRDGNHKH